MLNALDRCLQSPSTECGGPNSTMEAGAPSRQSLLAAAGPQLADIVELCLDASRQAIGRLQVRPGRRGEAKVGFLAGSVPAASAATIDYPVGFLCSIGCLQGPSAQAAHAVVLLAAQRAAQAPGPALDAVLQACGLRYTARLARQAAGRRRRRSRRPCLLPALRASCARPRACECPQALARILWPVSPSWHATGCRLQRASALQAQLAAPLAPRCPLAGWRRLCESLAPLPRRSRRHWRQC